MNDQQLMEVDGMRCFFTPSWLLRSLTRVPLRTQMALPMPSFFTKINSITQAPSKSTEPMLRPWFKKRMRNLSQSLLLLLRNKRNLRLPRLNSPRYISHESSCQTSSTSRTRSEMLQSLATYTMEKRRSWTC